MSSTGLQHAVSVTVSAAGLYPLKGIYYFMVNREYWSLFARRLIPLTILSSAVLALLFTFTYLPQVALLAMFQGSLSWGNAIFLVLGEGQVLIALLFEAFFVDETLVDTFDATLIRQGLTRLVSPCRLLVHDAPNAVQSLRKPTSSAIYSPFSIRQIGEFVLFLPLNLIPLVGTPLFLLLTGARAGPLHHYRYFKLLGLSKAEKRYQEKERGWAYTSFGTVALMLQLVPVFSMFFLVTTACGSALWVAQLEQQKVLVEQDTRETSLGTEEEDAPPAYTDNPA